MPSGEPNSLADLLVGRRAVEWLFARPDGGHFFDGAVGGVYEAFGGGARIGAFAPLDVDAEAKEFFLGVEGQVEIDEDWERLVAAHRVLFMQAKGFGVSSSQ